MFGAPPLEHRALADYVTAVRWTPHCRDIICGVRLASDGVPRRLSTRRTWHRLYPRYRPTNGGVQTTA